MSRNVLCVTVGALALVLGLLSYTLHKQTDSPPQPSAEEVRAQQARQAELQKKQLAARMQQMATQMKQMNQMSTSMKVPPALAAQISPGARRQLEAMLDAAKKLKNKKPVRTTVASDDWFKEGQDGTQGIAASEKQKATASRANASPASPAVGPDAAGR